MSIHIQDINSELTVIRDYFGDDLVYNRLAWEAKIEEPNSYWLNRAADEMIKSLGVKQDVQDVQMIIKIRNLVEKILS